MGLPLRHVDGAKPDVDAAVSVDVPVAVHCRRRRLIRAGGRCCMPGNWPSHEVVGDSRVCITPGQGGPKPPKHGAELCPKRFGKRLPIDNESGEQAEALWT